MKLEASDIVLEEKCDHWKVEDNDDWPVDECPHCLGTGMKTTELGLKVMEFVLRNMDNYRYHRDELQTRYNGFFWGPERMEQVRNL